MKKRKILALGLSLALGLGFVSNSYAAEEATTDSIQDVIDFFEYKEEYRKNLKELNISFSKGEEIYNKIWDAKTREEVETLYNDALSESEKNELIYPGRTYYIIGKKKDFALQNLYSIDISDEGVATGHYEKERKIISKEHYDTVVNKLNETKDIKEIYLLEDFIDYVAEDPKPEYKDPEADKTLLKKLLDKKYKKEDYTEDSYKFYTMIHTASKKVYDDKEAYQSDVDKALTNLNTAINLLEKVEKTEENKDVKENSEDKNKPATDKEKPEKNINKKIEEAIHRIEVKLGGLKYIKEAMPETYKRYKDIMDDAIVDTEKALKQAKEFLKN